MNFKRILALFLCAVLSLSFFSCRKVDKGDKDEGGKDKNDATEVMMKAKNSDLMMLHHMYHCENSYCRP